MLIAAGIMIAPYSARRVHPGLQPDIRHPCPPAADLAGARPLPPPLVHPGPGLRHAGLGRRGEQLALLIGVARWPCVRHPAYQALVQRREGLRSAWSTCRWRWRREVGRDRFKVVKQIGVHGGYSVVPVTN